MKSLPLIFLTLQFLLASPCLSKEEAPGEEGMKLLFEEARARVVKLLEDPEFTKKLPYDTHPETKQWILENHEHLKKDIQGTPHFFKGREDQEHCGLTLLKPQAPIQFSIGTCQQSVLDLKTVMQIVAHESVHHFGIADEDFPDAVAIAIVSTTSDSSLSKIGVWKEGLYPKKICESDIHIRVMTRFHSFHSVGKNIVGLSFEEETKWEPKHEIIIRNLCLAIFDTDSKQWAEVRIPQNGKQEFILPTDAVFFDAIDDDRVLIGFKESWHKTFKFWEYSLSKKEVLALPPPPKVFNFRKKVQVIGNELIFSGDSHKETLALQIYNFTDKSWTVIPVEGAGYGCTFEVGATFDHLLVAENCDFRHIKTRPARLRVYNRSQKTWSLLEGNDHLKWDYDHYFSLFQDENSFYFFNGVEGVRFFPASGQWTPIPRVPTAFRSQRLLWDQKHLILLGQNDFNEPDGYIYYPSTRQWRSLNNNGWHVSVVWMKDRFFFVNINNTEEFFLNQ